MIRTGEQKTIPYQTAFVINPAAGGGKAGRVWLKIESLLKQTGQQYRAYFTRFAGEGSGLAARGVLDGAELVVAVGGDGTLREVINGLDLNDNIFGVIPAGTGNGFIRSCGIPIHWHKALQGLAEWNPRQIDIGTVNGTYFLNVVGMGFDAAVARAAAAKYNKLSGYLAYLAAFLDQIALFKRFCCRVKCNGLYFEDNQTLLAVVANGSYYGGKLCIAPQAVIDDGYLDLCLIRKRNIPELAALGARVALKKHIESRALIKFKGQNICLEDAQRVPVHIDGDVVELPALEICVKPGALHILAPRRET